MSDTGLTEAERIAWAKAYPFDVPDSSYVYANGEVFSISTYKHGLWDEVAVQKDDEPWLLNDVLGLHEYEKLKEEKRYPIIACGSNGSPQRLHQKFEHLKNAVVLCLRATLTDHCIVYSAKINSYGSVPATLAKVPSARVHAFINLLNEEQLRIMDQTESLGTEYYRPVLDAGNLTLDDDGSEIDSAQAYISLRGCLMMAGEPIAVSSIDGEGIPFPHMDQIEVQTTVQGLLGIEGPLDEFIGENISSTQLRLDRCARLRDAHAKPWYEAGRVSI